MLSLLGALLGFGTSFLPKVMEYFQDRQDKAHELALQDKVLAAQIALGNQKLEATKLEGDTREIEGIHKEHRDITLKASRFFINLSTSIRPVVTYLFTFEYIAVTWAVAYLLIRIAYMEMAQDGMTVEALKHMLEALKQILDTEFMGLFSSILAFWFGDRRFSRGK